MYSLFLLFTLISVCVCTPRTPRIYNVLISSKKNLSPSHALPVYQPVLRTTSLGLAYPPLFYHQTAPQLYHNQFINQPIQQHQQIPIQNDRATEATNVQQPHQPQEPFTLGNLQSYLPHQEQGRNHQSEIDNYYNNANDPKNVIANLKRNPDIPDVPPPALPVRT